MLAVHEAEVSMSGPTLNATTQELLSSFPSLLDDEFWVNAFDERAPFYSSYVNYFRRALVEGIPSGLDVHREAVYSVKEEALGPIICSLVLYASVFPGASFVETLAFFVSSEENDNKLVSSMREISQDMRNRMRDSLDSLCAALMDLGDADLSEQMSSFSRLLDDLQGD